MIPFRLRFLALSASLFAIIMPHFSELNYGFGSFESLTFAVLSLLIGGAFAFLFRSWIGFGIVLGILVYVALDVYILETSLAFYAFGICICVVLILVRAMPIGVSLSAFIFGVIFGLPSFLTPTQPFLEIRQEGLEEASTGQQTQRYLHIILDEQMSPIAIDNDTLEAADREEILNTYLERGFRVHGHANAISNTTFASLGAIFGLSGRSDNYRAEDAAFYTYEVSDNRLIQILVQNGFSPTVIETNYLGLCGNDPRVTCQTYKTKNDMSGASHLGWQPIRRINLALLALRRSYLSGARQLTLYQKFIIQKAAKHDKVIRHHSYFIQPFNNINLMDSLVDSVEKMKEGDALIAHLLVPHYPYVLDRDCVFLPPADWRLPLLYRQKESAAEVQSAFWEQSLCVHKKLALILDAAAKHPDMLVVVHGDHGSRILRDTDFETEADNHATFFAVHAVNEESGLIAAEISLQDIAMTTFEKLFEQD